MPMSKVESNAVGEHAVKPRLADDAEAFSADRYNKLDFVVKIAGFRRVRHGRAAIDDSIRWLRKEERRLAIRILTHLAGVRGIVAANAEDAADRKPPGFACNPDRRQNRRIEQQ